MQAYDTSINGWIDAHFTRPILRKISASIVAESRTTKGKDKRVWPRGRSRRFFQPERFKRRSLRVRYAKSLLNRLSSLKDSERRARDGRERRIKRKALSSHISLSLSLFHAPSLARSFVYLFLLTDISFVIKSRAIFIESL